ncbi:hypothetical protein A6R68_11452 [Neotoma lepida]|uniref:Uncharacterized protein n=1 Tax=Neotoma lepida TaxID=56216 RepID=A0A1A6FU03_NEOLE|nr:hypothetical protein A6R68_11452 [Neotoma lepida]
MFLDLQILLQFCSWSPKELVESRSFSVSLKKMMSTNMLSQIP